MRPRTSENNLARAVAAITGNTARCAKGYIYNTTQGAFAPATARAVAKALIELGHDVPEHLVKYLTQGAVS